MKIFRYKFLVFLFLFIPEALYSQTTITVTKPRLEVSDENLVISYDILNTKSSDFFIVWIEVTDSKGNKINAVSVSGDVGKDIKGGKNKRITWNFGGDSIFIDDDLFVEVKAEKIAVQEQTAEVQTTKESETKDENIDNNKQVTENKETPENKKTESKEEKRTPIKEESSGKEISKGKMVLTSAVLPGWGQTKAHNGKPFWIIGAAGYGCIAGSVLMNRSASSAYDDYKLSMDPDESNALFDKANSRNNISKVLGYSAIGIWTADLIWVIATPNRNSQVAVKQRDRKLKITPGYDAGLNVGVVSISYNF